MTTRTKSIAVVAFAVALGTVMFVFTPDTPVPVSTPTPIPITVEQPASPAQLPDKESVLGSATPPLVATFASLPTTTARAARLARPAVIASQRRPHVYCTPERLGEMVCDAISGQCMPCQSSGALAGLEYHSDPSGEFLIANTQAGAMSGAVAGAAGAAMIGSAAAADPVMPCVRNIDFTPPALLFPPSARAFTHITVAVDGVDYGKRDFVKLSREVWRTTVPGACDLPAELPIVIDFWPSMPQDVGHGPLRIAVTQRTIVVKE